MISVPTSASIGRSAGLSASRLLALALPISGLILRTSATSVAGKVDGAAVAFGDIPDLSPAGNSPTAASGVTKVTGVNGNPSLLFDNAGSITLPVGLSVSARDYSVFVKARCCTDVAYGPWSDGGDHSFISLGTTPDNMFWIQPTASGMPMYDGVNYIPTPKTVPGNTAFTANGLRSNASRIAYRVNNQEVIYAAPASSNTLVGGFIGVRSGGGFPLRGEIQEVLVYDHALSDAELAAVLAFLGSDTYTKQVICYGDSITAGVLSAVYALKSSWPWYLQRLSAANKVLNFGRSGETLQTQAGNVATIFSGFIDATAFTKNIVICGSGTNDINAGRSSAQVIADFTTFTTAVTGMGGKPILSTILSRGSFDAGKEAIRQAVNTWLRANEVAVGYTLADVDANCTVGGVGTYANTTYFGTDQVHPNAVGSQGMAPEFLRAIGNVP